MAWVTMIRECKDIEVLEGTERSRNGVEGRMPGVVRMRRVCVMVPRQSIARIVGLEQHNLPNTKGAGPCGTFANVTAGTTHRGMCERGAVYAAPASPLAWSIEHLVEPIAAYYATYEPPQRIGAKIGPRGRKAA